jgi:hypothetical protein
MSTFLVVLQAIPVLLQLITAAETLFSGSAQGASKKEVVMSGVVSAIDAAVKAGAPITQEQGAIIKTTLGQTVDGVVAVLNRAGWPATGAGPSQS